MSRHVGRLFDAGVFICAIVLTGAVVRREVVSRRPPSEPHPAVVADWSALQRSGYRIGPLSAPVTIVEFSDFQCPVCAQFANEVLRPALRDHPGLVSVIYRHWPLSIHPFAFEAAVAAECAGRQDRFEAFHDALFRAQDSIGHRSFARFALDVGVRDTARFNDCLGDTAVSKQVEKDREAARAVGARGTPAFIVNGYLLRAPLDRARLDSIIDAARAK
jgi:protein-disulfide isomerase